jgi:hypothetical protein
MTLFTFFMIFPLAATCSLSGIQPSTERAFAAAYAIAIGSVHPIAGISSLERIDRYV